MPQSNSTPLAISFVIPARNEEALLGTTLDSLRRAAEELGQPWELLVVNDGSTDRTPEIARQQGARVIDVELHNIGAVRNAGAHQAQGEVIVFLDADTLLPAQTMRSAWEAIGSGAVGGGAWVQFDARTSLLQRWFAGIFCFFWERMCGWAAGCFIFARRADFEAVGGFDEQYFAAEERFLTEALRTRGKFIILRQPVITSARKLRLYSLPQLLTICFRALFTGRQQLQQREGLEILYDAPRETAEPPAPYPVDSR